MNYFLLFSLFGLFCTSFSPLCCTEYATKFVMTDLIIQYGAQTLPTISEVANVSLIGTNVAGCAYINGHLNANNAQLGSAVVNGNAFLVNCIIKDSISVYGNLQMQNCQVYGQISTYDPLLTLDKTKANSILNLSDQGQQTIVLINNTLVSGPITFQSGNGIVNLFRGSHISRELKGGRIK